MSGTVGFVGLGAMGEPMCRNVLRRSGRPVVVFDPDPAVVARLVADGATAVGSVWAVADAAEMVLLPLPRETELEQVVLGDDGLLARLRPGKTVVDLSTSPVELTRAMASRCADVGAGYCDAPVAGNPHAAAEGTLSIMVGGDDEDIERILPVLACMASDIIRCGGVGAGQVVKLMNNMVLVQNVVALAEAFTIATRFGVDGTRLFETMSKGSADSYALRNHGMNAMLPDDFPTRAFSSVHARTDIDYALELAESVAVDARGAQLARDLLEEAINAGFGHEFFPVIRRVLDREATVAEDR